MANFISFASRGFKLSEKNFPALREHLRAYTYVPYLSHSLLYFIDCIYEFHIQMMNFV